MRDERRERYCTGTKKRQRKTEIQSKSRDFFLLAQRRAPPGDMGMHICSPIWRLPQLRPSFNCRRRSTLVPRACARRQQVSPDLTLYFSVLAGHGDAGAGGM
jgi:hypothetical protein